MDRSYYSSSIESFLSKSNEDILGTLTSRNEFNLEINQRDAWVVQIATLKIALQGFDGYIHFEYSIPRMGRRIDVLLIIGSSITILIEY